VTGVQTCALPILLQHSALLLLWREETACLEMHLIET
jgi:hypothetical protein